MTVALLGVLLRGPLLLLVLGANLPVVPLAAAGSVTFALTANVRFGWTGLGGDLSLPVADLVRSVAILQLVSFTVCLSLRHWTQMVAANWEPITQKVSMLSFAAVLLLGVGSSWEQIVSLLGSRILLAAAVFTVLSAAAGGVLSMGSRIGRTTLAGITPFRNAGPAFAAVAIAADSDPETARHGARPSGG